LGLTVISLERLTVFVMGPLAFYIYHLPRTRDNSRAMWWMMEIAVSESYGGMLLTTSLYDAPQQQDIQRLITII